LEEKKDSQGDDMSKKIVKFTCTDGKKPVKKNGVFNLRSPIPLKLPVTLTLGVTCDRPLLVFEPKTLRDMGILVNPKIQVCEANEEIELTISGPVNTFIEVGDTVAHAIVMDDGVREEGEK
jgi:hypothetical protein